MAAIEVHDLTKRFGPVTAVDHLGFEVGAGTVTGFLGPNGAGKTTTLRMLLGLVEPTEGSALIGGRPYRDLPEPLHRVGAVLEASGAYPGRTARNHLRAQALLGRVPPARVDEVLDLVSLTGAADRRVGGFSLGMRQRLGLATALLCDPEVLVLDEPANGLDPEGVRWLRDLLRRLGGEGRTVLVSSHILAEVAQSVDSVVILDRGHLVAHSDLAELTARAQGKLRIRTPMAEKLQALLTAHGATAVLVGPNWVEVTGGTAEEVGLLAAEQAIPIFEASTEGLGLEEVFFQLTDAAAAKESTR
ncbi:MAG TPA: ATP-binding cassette domain-containing protein [Acidimicrobiales bacterium]|nr:ATP-binding cassette domain-containing protein [Acidimicrobiales bacterium]